jgi:HEAT repeat protein
VPVELSPTKRLILDILESGKSISSSKLVSLSNLSNEEIDFLANAWLNADLERRHEIMSQLVHLSEVDLKLDFSRVFALALSDPEEKIKIQAAVGLEGEDNYLLIKPLVKALKVEDSAKVKAAVAITLGHFALQGELGDLPNNYCEKVYNALLEVLDSKTESTAVQRRALESISPFNTPRIKELIKTAYHSDDTELKTSAIYAMGHNCNLDWLPILLSELKNEEAEIRYESAGACGELGAEEAVPYLLKMVTDIDERVREASIKALGEIGNEPAKRALKRLAQNTEQAIRNAAESALQEIEHCEELQSFHL